MRFLRLTIAGSAVAIFCIPVDFVELAPWSSALALLALALGAAATGLLWSLGHSRPGKSIEILAGVVILFAVNLSVAPIWPPAVVTVLVVLCGLGLASLPEIWVYRTILTVFCLTSASIIIDYMTRSHVTSALFGVPFQQQSISNAEYRARGFLGQAVPAGALTTVWAFYLIGRRGLAKRPPVLVAGVIAALISSIVMSGTRTALGLIAFGLVLVALLHVRLRTKIPPSAIPVVFAAIVVGLAIGRTRLEGLRILSLSGVEGTESFQVRALAEYVLEIWWSRCDDVTCRAFGLGFRDLLATLQGGIAGSFTTIDNQYVSLLWDFGFAGVVALTVATVFLVRKLTSNSAVGSAALAGLLVLAGGWLFDVLYLRAGLLTFSILVAMASLDQRQTADDPPKTLSRTK